MLFVNFAELVEKWRFKKKMHVLFKKKHRFKKKNGDVPLPS